MASSPKVPQLLERSHPRDKGRRVAFVNYTDPTTGKRRQRVFGDTGTPQAERNYRAFLRAWAEGEPPLPVSVNRGADTPERVTISTLLARFLRWADERYENAEASHFGIWVRPLRKLFGDEPAADFGPRELLAVRDEMVASGLCRSEVNRRVCKLRQVFRWGVAREVVPERVWSSLRALQAIPRGAKGVRETEPVRPVPWAAVEATLPHLSDQLRAMVRLQWLTGMRPGEVCAMRTGDLDRSRPECWIYSPPHHKTAHRGKGRLIGLDMAAQEVLGPFLKADPAAPLFSPREAGRDRSVSRRPPGETYTTASYRRAIARACKRAEAWGPNRLRHGFATRVAAAHGAEVARVRLGHADQRMTARYVEPEAVVLAVTASSGGAR